MSHILSGLLTINGQDVYNLYGAYLVEDRAGECRNYDELLRPAERKPLVEVNYSDRNGAKLPDTLPTALEAREVTLKFAIEADGMAAFLVRYTAFVEMLKSGDKGWLHVRLKELDKTYKMYYVSCSEWRQLTHLTASKVVAKVVVRLREPNPQY